MISPSKTLPAAPVNSFKRLTIGDTFTAKEGRFRKVGGRTAFKLLPSGTGQKATPERHWPDARPRALCAVARCHAGQSGLLTLRRFGQASPVLRLTHLPLLPVWR